MEGITEVILPIRIHIAATMQVLQEAIFMLEHLEGLIEFNINHGGSF